jgi:tetratricopeptide (TPR) repeat protein
MLQGDRLRFLHRLGYSCLVCLLLLAITAAVQRQRELTSVERECIAALQTFAEHGVGDAWDYLYPWQGYSVYLIENQRRSPELLRLLLLCEARRVHPESYMNSYSINYDLRRELMQTVLPKYRDDPQVHWAAGICHMNASEFSEAQHELEKALELGLSFDNTGVDKEDVLIRIMLAAAMDGDPTETMHWVRDTQLGDDEALQTVYADMLCRLYMYDECIEYCEANLGTTPPGLTVGRIIHGANEVSVASAYVRALWWDGNFDVLRQLYSDYQTFEPDSSHEQMSEVWYWGSRGNYNPLILGRFAMLTEKHAGWDSADLQTVKAFPNRGKMQLLAENWALLGDQQSRDSLADILANGKERLEDGAYGTPNQLSWEERDALQTVTAKAYGQLVRSELLRHDWSAAQKLLDDNADNYYWPTPTPISTAEFLLGIVNGAELPELTDKLRGCIIIAPFLFHSPEYLAACQAGQRDPMQLQKELVHALANPDDPDSDYWSGASNYSDWSNGTLDW